jgi:transcriptional regulator with XRE-family HTH domain
MAREKSDENQAFGRAVQEARIERGLSREAFATKVELDPRRIEAIERGEVNVVYTLILRAGGWLGYDPGGFARQGRDLVEQAHYPVHTEHYRLRVRAE